MSEKKVIAVVQPAQGTSPDAPAQDITDIFAGAGNVIKKILDGVKAKAEEVTATLSKLETEAAAKMANFETTISKKFDEQNVKIDSKISETQGALTKAVKSFAAQVKIANDLLTKHIEKHKKAHAVIETPDEPAPVEKA